MHSMDENCYCTSLTRSNHCQSPYISAFWVVVTSLWSNKFTVPSAGIAHSQSTLPFFPRALKSQLGSSEPFHWATTPSETCNVGGVALPVSLSVDTAGSANAGSMSLTVI